MTSDADERAFLERLGEELDDAADDVFDEPQAVHDKTKPSRQGKLRVLALAVVFIAVVGVLTVVLASNDAEPIDARKSNIDPNAKSVTFTIEDPLRSWEAFVAELRKAGAEVFVEAVPVDEPIVGKIVMMSLENIEDRSRLDGMIWDVTVHPGAVAQVSYGRLAEPGERLMSSSGCTEWTGHRASEARAALVRKYETVHWDIMYSNFHAGKVPLAEVNGDWFVIAVHEWGTGEATVNMAEERHLFPDPHGC